jgi:hypothetical protein
MYRLKIAIVCTILLAVPFTLLAQDVPTDTTYWRKGLKVAVNFTQASFSENWKGGGVNSIAIGSIVTGRADYLKGKISFDNEMELQYGLVRNEGSTTRKSNDRILLDSKIGYALSEKWNAFAGVNFLSQFDKGYRFSEDSLGEEQRVVISDFLAPGFLTTSFGFEYKPVPYFQVRLAPLAPRFTFVTDTTIYRNVPNNYGVPIGETVRTEWLSAQIQAMFDKDIAENVNLKWRYLLFANYEEFAFNTIDHRLDLTITAQVTKWLNANLAFVGLYDRDQDDDIQLSQILALGLQYSLGDNN